MLDPSRPMGPVKYDGVKTREWENNLDAEMSFIVENPTRLGKNAECFSPFHVPPSF